MKQITIKLKKDGGVEVEATGFKGGSCLEKTKFLEDVFGEAAETTLKPSFHEKEEAETIFNSNGLPSGWCG